MMNFVNSIPTNIGWMLVGVVAAILLYFLLDIIKMAFIGIKGRLEKNDCEDFCPLCGQRVDPFDENEGSYIYRCPCCGTQWKGKL